MSVLGKTSSKLKLIIFYICFKLIDTIIGTSLLIIFIEFKIYVKFSPSIVILLYSSRMI
ncbi:hypothetical protein BTU51_0055 [Rickettsia rickettsii]|uniref:Uncharacterized protein n=1 Tax=Rickettsia rickettsii (strain Iowa) TaxID=452659 RepID=B0BVV8_RICRO|nr:hypothetical protein RrIowa_0055 [Rickettsia rickettsii str. Iowa]APU54936.1 hypothetical protein BTU50_0055 [Rickettsia rickettsii]APU56313.1 hypothetical protein BTU51_0055 [Rickettsia rickettsii]